MEEGSIDFLPPYEAIEGKSQIDDTKPATFILVDRVIVSENAPSTPLYQINYDITSTKQRHSSVAFESVENDPPLLGIKGGAPINPEPRPLFYLAHPQDPQYREDRPPYYLTSVSPGSLGNIALEISKSRLQRTEYRFSLSPNRNWMDDILFDRDAQLLFSVKSKLIGGRLAWTDSNGFQLAYEDGKDAQHRLVITVPMKVEIRHALVATWCLRLWHDTAESRQAKKEGEFVTQ